MRIVIDAIRKCWILYQNHREASDIELDEGPLNKHRRLTLDRWTAVTPTANMDRMRMDRDKRSADLINSGLLTKEVGVLCNNLVPVNDKCIMVGTTGIAALKAEYGDDFTNFEIIQDVGYSSESSTHLSSDDGISVGGDRYFNIRVYDYADQKPTTKSIGLREELDSADSKQASSVGSSSGPPSFDDSGLGATDLLPATGDPPTEARSEKTLPANDCGNRFDYQCLQDDESDFLETVFESCVDFGASDGGKEDAGVDDLQYELSGIESDDSADNFHKKRSFTTSSQLFYKMILVDSENEEEVDGNENNNVPDKFSLNLNPTNAPSVENEKLAEFPNDLNENIVLSKENSPQDNKSLSTDSEQETFKAPLPSSSPVLGQPRSSYQKSKCLISTPVSSSDRRDTRNFASPNLKRKRDSDSNDLISTWEGGGGIRVRTWLKRCSRTLDTVPKTRVRRCLFRSGSGYSSGEEPTPNAVSNRLSEDISSCDASGEYTSSSADEGNAMSSSSSFFDDDLFHFKERLDSCSGEGSVETVIRGLKGPRRSDIGSGELLPPPLSSTPSSLRRRQRTTGSLRCCDGPFSNHSCADLRWFVMKASSEGDLRTRTWMSSTEHSSTNIPTSQQHKDGLGSFPFDFKQRLSSSLPNVLRHRSDSSTDDTKGSSFLSNSDSKTYRRCSHHDDSFVSHNQSSSSDLERKKKRRSRRKSSSSNRSSRTVLTGSDKSRVRSRTLTSQCSSRRRRNLSQRSDFFDGSENNFFSESDGSPAAVHKVSKDDLNPKNLKDELELALKDNIKNSASLLSPAESDVVLTHLEEQSTVSDQVWDGYQDMPYLSEAYSEATVDEDAVRKLTEFGDDYGSAIGQPLRFLDAADDTKVDISKSPSKKSSKSHSHSTDSDSDLEDLHHVIEEAGKALQFARATLKTRQSGDFFSSAENAELLATCGTHLHCLQTICEHIAIDGKENNFSDADLKILHYLIEEWKNLKRSIEMYEEVDDDKIRQKYLKAQKNIDELFSKMSELSSLSEIGSKDFRNWDDLQDSISRLQMVLSMLQDTREQLLSVNLQVHRFVTEYGSDAKYKDISLKEDITELYQKWEDIYEMNGTQLTELETLNTNWKKYIDKFKDLNSKVLDHLSSHKNCDINCHNLEDEVTFNLQKDLKELKADSASLRKHLKNSETWKSIQRDLFELEKRINAHSSSSSVSRSADHPNSSTVEDDPDDHFEDAIQQMDAYESLQRKKLTAHPHHPEDVARSAKKSSRFWRILRVAVPVQLTLVLLFCLACYLEPNCCDRLNNFNFSFTPHLRYLRGPPPV